jgi:hypothetical protein
MPVMKEIDFPEFRLKCSAIIEKVRKMRRPVRPTRFGAALAGIIPLSETKNEPGAKRLRKSPRASKGHRRR